MERFSKSVEIALRASGWFPGRNVDHLVGGWEEALRISDGFEIFAEARRILSEFGDLTIEPEPAGRFYAREPFKIDPKLAGYERDRFDEFKERLKTNLYPIGEACGGLYFLAVDESGQIFLLMQDIHLLGRNIEEALENLILGTTPEETSLSQ